MSDPYTPSEIDQLEAMIEPLYVEESITISFPERKDGPYRFSQTFKRGMGLGSLPPGMTRERAQKYLEIQVQRSLDMQYQMASNNYKKKDPTQ